MRGERRDLAVPAAVRQDVEPGAPGRVAVADPASVRGGEPGDAHAVLVPAPSPERPGLGTAAHVRREDQRPSK